MRDFYFTPGEKKARTAPRHSSPHHSSLTAAPQGAARGHGVELGQPAGEKKSPLVSSAAGPVKKITTCLLATGPVKKKSTHVPWPAGRPSPETSLDLFFGKNPVCGIFRTDP